MKIMGSIHTLSQSALVPTTGSVQHRDKNKDHEYAINTKVIHFDLARDSKYSGACENQEEVDSMWYSAMEFGKFKHTTQKECRGIMVSQAKHRGRYSYEAVLNEIFYRCCTDPYADLASLDVHMYKSLVHWMSIAPQRIGLERRAIKTLFDDKFERSRKIVHAVLMTQSLASDMQVHVRMTLIRDCSEQISLPSRLFAKIIGQSQTCLET